MLNSSIEIINCLEILRNQPFSQYFKKVLSMVYEDVKAGKLLSEAMEKHKKIFPDFFRNMVYVGEMSSSLEKILNNVADYYETEQKTRGKVKSAMVYPITLMVMMVGILAIMLVFVVPTFRSSLSQLDIEMPALTQAIFVASDFFTTNWKTIFLALVGLWLIFKIFKKTPRGRFLIDTIKIKMPLFKKYQIASVTSKFSRGFGLLLASGMNMVECMEVIKKVLGNRYVEKKFEKATEDVKKGVKLTTALEQMEIFPVMLIQMVSIGEKTASLEDVLNRSCDYFDEQLQITLNSLTSLMQPALMLIMGVLIGIIFIAVYSPLISIMENLA